ncbi:HlyD family efflux transporter periplasmic adaptor subunit [Anaerosphaera multitolerans]|uniref:HlyD family efflux transporter periplasmic adaptor subunit n=1 Tax=Anaerosphaera multitolerans TaxID=2487351 RepID=A0A437S6K4_9FIRM|nr:HlyD family efflux transporter periplasmic adaptor subunit [Anaerosphaera multitolerans]RVU54614.1 HlyD family efflux transporter periplasmic adaptor subunit [Anaerosphaera multitolerans]
MDKVKSVFGKVKNFIGRNKIKVIVVAVVIIAVWFLFFRGKNGENYTIIPTAETISLAKEDFISSVSETGKVKSEDSVSIYPEKSLPISEVKVEVGDVVKEGDIIARLDDSSIRQQIAQTQATIGATKKTAGAQIKSAEDQLNEAKKNREDGTNSAISGANSSLINAYDSWQSAEKTYQDFRKSLEERYNDALIAAESSEDTVSNSLKTAQLNYEQAQEELRETRDTASRNRSLARGEQDRIDSLQSRIDELDKKISRETSNVLNNTQTDNYQTATLQTDVSDDSNELKRLQTELAEAKANLSKYENTAETAENSITSYERKVEQMNLALETAKQSEETDKDKAERNEKSRQDQLETYRKNAEAAKNAYDNALKNLEVTKVAAEDQITSLENSVNIAQASSDTSTSQVSLKYLYEDLDKTVIRAPISGTVTSKTMEKGQVAAGSICTIETVDEQVIESSVKEFDLNDVKVGMKVVVTSEAIGKEKPFSGKVVSIDPAPMATESVAGATGAASKDVTYRTKIKLDKNAEELKPGMNIRAKYILEEQKNVYKVPSTAIYEKNGKNFILIATSNKKGTKLSEVEVITGLENDVETVVQSDKLKDGVIVITSPDKYSNGLEVEFIDETEVAV